MNQESSNFKSMMKGRKTLSNLNETDCCSMNPHAFDGINVENLNFVTSKNSPIIDRTSSANIDFLNRNGNIGSNSMNLEFIDANDDDSGDYISDNDLDDDVLDDMDYEWTSNPFMIIDENANLEEVLAAKTIGEAMQILCPNIPGLPTKSRGKYKKRKLLSNEEKSEALRATNRENARLTRKRKKIYHDVISSLLIRLHQDLGNDAVKKYVNIVNQGKSRQYLEDLCRGPSSFPLKDLSGVSEVSASTDNTDTDDQDSNIIKIKKELINGNHSIPIHRPLISIPVIKTIDSKARVDTIRRFLDYRVSSCHSVHQNLHLNRIKSLLLSVKWTDVCPSRDDWMIICAPDLIVSAPPVFRECSQMRSSSISTGYDFQGLSSILDDMDCLSNFCRWVISNRFFQPDLVNWTLAVEIDDDSILVSKAADQICLEYRYCLYAIVLRSASNTTCAVVVDKPSSSFPYTPITSDYDIHATMNVTLSKTSPSNKLLQKKSFNENAEDLQRYPQLVKVMDIPVVMTIHFNPDGRLRLITEHFDVMQILLDKEKLRHSSLFSRVDAITGSVLKTNFVSDSRSKLS